MQKVFWGIEASTIALKETIERSHCRKFFIVHGKRSFTESGAENIIKSVLNNYENILTEVFSDFGTNPKYEDLLNGINQCLQFSPDLIIACGGGSVIDMSKLVRFFCAYQGDILQGNYTETGQLKPLIAIPTTAGTGAEATKFAVLYKDNIKHSIENPQILPDTALICPQFTYNTSPYLTACAGFDALAQAVEAYWNRNASEESDSYAEKAMELIIPSLYKVVNKPTEELRGKMSEGAYWAGRAINITKTTAPHAFSYPFTSHYGYPHGHAVALSFPYIAEYNFNHGNIPNHKLIFLSSKLRVNATNVRTSLLELTHSLGLALKPREYDIEKLLGGINLNRLSNNPAKIDDESSRRIIQNILSQK